MGRGAKERLIFEWQGYVHVKRSNHKVISGTYRDVRRDPLFEGFGQRWTLSETLSIY